MSFETLADKYNLTKKNIYGRFSNPEQLVEIKPDSPESRQRIVDDTRALPLRSTFRDGIRIGKFLVGNPVRTSFRVSPFSTLQDPGVLFIGKQLLLQTGNTFAQTRLYDPSSPLVHVIPFVHRPRHFKTGTLYNGALQNETVNSFNRSTVGNVGGTLVGNAITRSARNAINQIGKTVRTFTSTLNAITASPTREPEGKFYLRPEDNQASYRFSVNNYRFFRVPLYNSQPMENRGQRRFPLETTVRESGRTSVSRFARYAVDANLLARQFEAKPRPSTSDFVNEQLNSTQRTVNEFSVITAGARAIVPSGTSRPAEGQHSVRALGRTVTFNSTLQGYMGGKQTLDTNGYLYGDSNPQDSYSSLENTSVEKVRSKSTGLADFYNLRQIQTGSRPHSVNYSSIAGEQTLEPDIIKFIFKSVNETEPVQFRALISELRQGLRAEYNETRYIGRTERFVNYAGAKRDVNMTFNIVAFSPRELDNMWLRINYLTGLAFPRTVTSAGFMVPPLFRITVGDIYVDQPCYIESLDFDFLDNSITFDTDKEVSQVINVKMSLVLLEKRSKFIDSPYYGIMERLAPNSMQTSTGAEVRRPELGMATTTRPIVTVPVLLGSGTPEQQQTPVTASRGGGPTQPFDGFGGGGGFSGGGSGGRIP